MNDALFADSALVAASFRKFTGKRKGEAFVEAGSWWVIDADGHQWGHAEVDGEDTWVCFTDDNDEYVVQVRCEKRAGKAAGR
jgi:hypothetical protein